MSQFESTKVKTKAPVSTGLSQRMEFLKKYEELVNDPQYLETAPPDSRAGLQDTIDRARQSFKDEKRKNEWAEVAQQIGNAAVQFAAASAGKDQRDMSNLNFGKGIDYNARTGSAFEEYRQEVRNAMGLASLPREAAQDANVVRKENFKRKEGYLKEGLDAVKDQERNTAMIETETKRSLRDNLREDERRKRDEVRQSETDRKLTLAELNQQEKDLEKQLQARQTIANQAEKSGDIDPKSLKKITANSPDLAARADLDLTALEAKFTETDKPGRLWGTNPDPEARKAVLSNAVKETRTMLDQIRARKQSLISGSKTGEAPPAGPEKIRVKRKGDGQTGTIDAKDFDPAKYDRL